MNSSVSMIMLSSLVISCIYLSACSQAQQGSAQALDNLGSVIKSESKKVWIANDGSVDDGSVDEGSVDSDTAQLDQNETRSHNGDHGHYY